MEWLPKKLDDARVAFPATVSDLMPTYAELRTMQIPQKWIGFQSDWFFKGINAGGLVPREGIDKTLALRHLKAIQGSYEPKHEHKELGVAYLASLWFADESKW